ncbi:TRAP transporter small permease [Sneathiella sp.]|uniref:TRAP transporter small permease n=1 Tax=Sneathiella sp. TaxID=1964365 RepID=UPI002623495A|nr:TRAP transporter small permease subunit [Sneathiella sp.]MDF2368432.1 TRAP transporter small permease subunit [Sneathiella sp.]
MTSIVNAITKISNGCDRVATVAAITFLGAMVFAIALQVVARYAFDSPPPWTEEVARYAMVWVGLLGATVSFKAGFDPVLTRVSDSLPVFLKRCAGLVRWAAVLVFLLPILWYSFFGPGTNFVRGFLARHWYLEAETFEVSTFYVAIGIPIFIVVILLHGLSLSLLPISKRNDQENDSV